MGLSQNLNLKALCQILNLNWPVPKPKFKGMCQNLDLKGCAIDWTFYNMTFHRLDISWINHFMDRPFHGSIISWINHFIDRSFHG